MKRDPGLSFFETLESIKAQEEGSQGTIKRGWGKAIS